MQVLVCPVRGCSQPMDWGESGVLCPRGHRFDRARSGYVSLLQPQDRKSTSAGDSREAVAARRRTLERGLGDRLLDALELRVAGRVLDLGCGEGFFLGQLAARRGLEAWGTDLSTPAVDAAARRYPHARWFVANADRTLPLADGAFDRVLSITARKNGPEIARLLAPGGRAVIVVSAEDDLAELRARLHGQATEKDRGARTIDALAPWLRPVADETVRSSVELDREGVEDVLAGTYRGARHRERERLADVERLVVTSSYRILELEPTSRPG